MLIDALMTLGKTTGTIQAAAETDSLISMFVSRGRKEQYERIIEYCREHGLSCLILPSVYETCPRFSGEHGTEWQERIKRPYRRGASASTIHAELADELPCLENGPCPYEEAWDFDSDEIDVLVGYYGHAHNPSVISGRHPVFDEFPTAFTTTFSDSPNNDHSPFAQSITTFLQREDDLPFENFIDLLAARGSDDERWLEAASWFNENSPQNEALAFEEAGHSLAPLAVYTILYGVENDLGNGLESVSLPERGRGVFNRGESEITLLRPPNLRSGRGLVALDGTPVPSMWRTVLGRSLHHHRVLSNHERREYVRDALNLTLVRSTDDIKPYSSGAYVNVDEDASLLDWIGTTYNRKPALITAKDAKDEYHEAENIDFRLVGPDEVTEESCVRAAKHYGNILGSNDFRQERLGVVIGSRHFGDDFIKKWSALMDHGVERSGKGKWLTYGPIGDKVLRYMREYQTLQAAMRFGRDGQGAVVFVHTNTLPDWIPTKEGEIHSDGMREVVRAMRDLKQARTSEVASEVTVSERQVRIHLQTLADRGHVSRTEEGRGITWWDDGLHRISDYGIPPINLPT
jgi:hypothetical protein